MECNTSIIIKLSELYINRCLALAELGIRNAMPNPSVGAVIVYDNKIIGEGHTSAYGGNHAEVNAINSVKDKNLLAQSTLYVSLEPCSHFGKTPPCSNLIVKHQIPKVVIGCIDTFSKVSGNGVKMLRESGVAVTIGVLEKECRAINKRFFTFHEQKRPYITLKWAQSPDGFIDSIRKDNSTPAQAITNKQANRLVHQWRSEEMSIMVGTNTALLDNPSLNTRHISGKNPIRIVLDSALKIPLDFNLYDSSTPTLIFTNKTKKNSSPNIEYITIDFQKEVISQLLNKLYQRNILSLLVEGGSQLLQSFIDENNWDEAKIFTGTKLLKKGIKSPIIPNLNNYKYNYYENQLNHYINI